MLAIGRALVARTRLMMLDEPFLGLADAGQKKRLRTQSITSEGKDGCPEAEMKESVYG